MFILTRTCWRWAGGKRQRGFIAQSWMFHSQRGLEVEDGRMPKLRRAAIGEICSTPSRSVREPTAEFLRRAESRMPCFYSLRSGL